jgi:hypothetical protein
MAEGVVEALCIIVDHEQVKGDKRIHLEGSRHHAPLEFGSNC